MGNRRSWEDGLERHIGAYLCESVDYIMFRILRRDGDFADAGSRYRVSLS
jgi:hypothetical protein